MELRAKGVIEQNKEGRFILELEHGAGSEAIRPHLGEEVELVIHTKEERATVRGPSRWNVEDQQ